MTFRRVERKIRGLGSTLVPSGPRPCKYGKAGCIPRQSHEVHSECTTQCSLAYLNMALLFNTFVSWPPTVRRCRWGHVPRNCGTKSSQPESERSAEPPKEESKVLKKIKLKKKECCSKFLMQSRNRNPWEIVTISRDPFGIRETMGHLTDQEGKRITTQQETVEAF